MKIALPQRLKSLIGLIIICSLSSCKFNNNIKKTYNYSDYYNYQIEWKEIFNQKYEQYYVYFYDESCLQCNKAKPYILQSIDQKKYFIYLIDVKKEVNTLFGDKTIIGCSNIDDFTIRGTPTLIEIYNKTIDLYLAGSSDIIDFLSVVFLP